MIRGEKREKLGEHGFTKGYGLRVGNRIGLHTVPAKIRPGEPRGRARITTRRSALQDIFSRKTSFKLNPSITRRIHDATENDLSETGSAVALMKQI